MRLALAVSLVAAVGGASVLPAAGADERAAPHPVASRAHRVEYGVASWYGFDDQGKITASGKPFDARKLTAAHPRLPFDSKAKVVNLQNGKSVEVTITDRGPAVPGRAIDLSRRAAQRLGMTKAGLAPVKIEPLPQAPRTVAMDWRPAWERPASVRP